ncbi:MAG: hypothetical protein FWD97_01065 [Defluviitaleaceae bacterium]|nr:hypothetical protein [Defluviitaleaceae bacterium]
MTNGFMGKAAVSYLTAVSEAHTDSGDSILRIPPSVEANPHYSPRLGAKQIPFLPQDAVRGHFTTGYGNSGNIVTDLGKCKEMMHKISNADDRMGECIYRIALEIEAMCQTIYRLPQTVPECLNICGLLKSSMGEFREVTEDAVLLMRGHAREMSEIR